jgi:hypothetical protein
LRFELILPVIGIVVAKVERRAAVDLIAGTALPLEISQVIECLRRMRIANASLFETAHAEQLDLDQLLGLLVPLAVGFEDEVAVVTPS